MIDSRIVKASLLTLATWVMVAAPAVHGAMYKWTDEAGTATFSNQPPAEPDKVRDLAVLEGIATAPAAPVRDAQVVNPDTSGASRTRSQTDRASHTRVPAKFGESFRSDPPPRAAENNALPHQDGDIAVRELARVHARGRTEAVRDPCLISSDPKCHERNKERYHPYFGYAPSVTQPTPPLATGATSTHTAGGAVGLQAPRESGPVPRRLEPAPSLITGSR